MAEHVRFARRRFGHSDVMDFVAVLLSYSISGERTLEAFYERLQPFAVPFMALFGRERGASIRYGENSISLFMAVFVLIWPQFGEELALLSSNWRLFWPVTGQKSLQFGAGRIIP